MKLPFNTNTDHDTQINYGKKNDPEVIVFRYCYHLPESSRHLIPVTHDLNIIFPLHVGVEGWM